MPGKGGAGRLTRRAFGGKGSTAGPAFFFSLRTDQDARPSHPGLRTGGRTTTFAVLAWKAGGAVDEPEDRM
jgi:hypothetical protein